jgi:hypothetical protein
MSKSVKSFLLSPLAEQIFVLYYVKAIEKKNKNVDVANFSRPQECPYRASTHLGRTVNLFLYTARNFNAHQEQQV